ncbi:hypothetical protein [Limimaricola cinnabarinus]|uniref:Uncharacterized protein n=1 Tax=Limimaricola cinnabarinus LL-001 TaxID=1337093 RepID=U2Z770_9RHOB|nr:hypothetical protein [Limimaricola cinnabarinus]GAD57275.1 hypothetical protein MBELCI_3327 [Limimaricola cinnabarinus LL-001]
MITVLRLSLPLAIWLASFSGVYGLHGLMCSSRWAGPPIGLSERGLLIGAAILAIAVQSLCLVVLRAPKWRDPDPAMRRIGLALAAIALVAAIWTLLPPTVLASCM